MSLSDYLSDVSELPFRYGALDCCTFMADWLVRRGFADPMADRRGGYATRAEYEACMSDEGGIVRSCRRRFAGVRLARTRSPVCGDVCLVRVPVLAGQGEVMMGVSGAICVSDQVRAVVTSDAGLVLAPMSIVCAWSSVHG